jgi:hypothetical protein
VSCSSASGPGVAATDDGGGDDDDESAKKAVSHTTGHVMTMPGEEDASAETVTATTAAPLPPAPEAAAEDAS